MFLVFNVFNLPVFWHSFKLRDLFSFICFFKSLLKTWSSLSVFNRPGFSSTMHIFNTETVPCKGERQYLKFTLQQRLSFFSVSDVFSLEASGSYVFPGENGELRNSLKLLSFLLFLFTFTSWASISFSFQQTFP